ncbi:MAG: N-acetyltransferase family protein [Hyphomonadaceae bacterium]
MLIRDLRAEDKAEWLPLWRGYLDFYEHPWNAAEADDTFARLLDPAVPMFAIVAEDEAGALIGVAQCVLHLATRTPGQFCYLNDLFTAPAARKQGVGRALIEAVYARADQHGWPRVYWLTHETNTPGRALYDKVGLNRGFIQYVRRPPA